MSLLAGCGDNADNHSENNNPSSPTETPETPNFEVSSCEVSTSAEATQQLESAKANITDILTSLREGDFHTAQAFSTQAKTTFKGVLDAYPNNCEAQLGYALSIVTDLMNNKEIKGFIDTVSNKKDLVDMGVDDFNKILVTTDGKLLTSVAQTAMTQAIPSLDSAVIYMRSVVNNKDFTCKYTYEDRTYELDRSEFAPTLGALFVAKAILTFGASLNIDISDNGRYDWMNDLGGENFGDVPELVLKQIKEMLNPKSSLTIVYSNWTANYKDIPNLLDSAISYVELGLQFGIEESKSGATTQLNDPYIVGDGEMADVSVGDFQKAIDSLEFYRQALRTGIEVTLPRGSKIKINIAKFFDITDGFQDYLPYHHINDASEWHTPVDGYYWSEVPNTDSYMEMELKREIGKQIKKTGNIHYYDAWINHVYYWEEEQPDYEWHTCIDIDYTNGPDDYNCFSMKFDNCAVTFGASSGYYHNDQSTISAPSPIKLSSNVCKVENGTHLFARAYRNAIENMFYFTDAKGNKTLSLQALKNGYIDSDGIKNYTVRDFGKYIFFPDITFGGVLPGMTADKFWDIIITESEGDDQGD